MKYFAKRLSPRWLVLGIAALTVSACASADVATINGASQDQISSIQVSEVNVLIETPRPAPALQATLTDELRKTMPICATGTIAHKMNVTITEFDEQNVAKAIFIGDEIELGGRIELVDSSTETQTGEYYVNRSFFWGGFIGAAMMSNPERSLSEGFAETICGEVFGIKLKKK